MSFNPKDEKVEPAGGKRLASNDKPPMLQPGPIIIKDGSVEIYSPIFKFKDKDGKEGKNFKHDVAGYITRIVVMDGDDEVGDIEPTNKETTIVITFTPS